MPDSINVLNLICWFRREFVFANSIFIKHQYHSIGCAHSHPLAIWSPT